MIFTICLILTVFFWFMAGWHASSAWHSRDTDQLLHDIASQDGWLRTDQTRELWTRLQAWKRDHPNKGLDVK